MPAGGFHSFTAHLVNSLRVHYCDVVLGLFRENAAELSAVMLMLEPSYREVLTLRFHEEMSLEEIATVTRAPLSTVKSRLYRGLAVLKPQLTSLHAERVSREVKD